MDLNYFKEAHANLTWAWIATFSPYNISRCNEYVKSDIDAYLSYAAKLYPLLVEATHNADDYSHQINDPCGSIMAAADYFNDLLQSESLDIIPIPLSMLNRNISARDTEYGRDAMAVLRNIDSETREQYHLWEDPQDQIQRWSLAIRSANNMVCDFSRRDLDYYLAHVQLSYPFLVQYLIQPGPPALGNPCRDVILLANWLNTALRSVGGNIISVPDSWYLGQYPLMTVSTFLAPYQSFYINPPKGNLRNVVSVERQSPNTMILNVQDTDGNMMSVADYPASLITPEDVVRRANEWKQFRSFGSYVQYTDTSGSNYIMKGTVSNDGRGVVV